MAVSPDMAQIIFEAIIKTLTNIKYDSMDEKYKLI